MTRWKQWRKELRERPLHNDRDASCRYWWGDRGGYSLRAEKCAVCGEGES